MIDDDEGIADEAFADGRVEVEGLVLETIGAGFGGVTALLEEVYVM